ncbi:hypothetical protein C5167_023985 [Papaver somniferum]|uniref:Pentacotripeptide-repeat region of PRORP domain-containing protein n=1 Tax=Papaver somniferum TaxID=3469 RepID=A0A4Y7JM91_PAPSO|nr:hypothetical protein C5167_023985 [Papaver somniferum]
MVLLLLLLIKFCEKHYYDYAKYYKKKLLEKKKTSGDREGAVAGCSATGGPIQTRASKRRKKVTEEDDWSVDETGGGIQSATSTDDSEESSILRCLELRDSGKIESEAWGLHNDVARGGEKQRDKHSRGTPNAEFSSGGRKDSYVFKFKTKEKHISEDKISPNVLVINGDRLRCTTLAKFLMDEDNRGDLKKSMKELTTLDPKEVDNCKKLSKRYMVYLFGIYEKFMEMLVVMLRKLLELSSVCQICPSTRTFNFVLNLLVSSKRYKIVNDVYMDVARLGVVVNTCSFNILVKGLCKNDDVKKGFELLDEFPKQDCQSNAITYSTLHFLCRNGRTDEAFKLLDRMENEVCDPDTITFSLLISGLGKQGRADEGVDRLDRTKMSGFKPNSGSYQVFLYSIINSKKFIDAKHFIDRNRTMSEGFSPSSFVVQDGDRGTLQQ